jgi:hypothetical protein
MLVCTNFADGALGQGVAWTFAYAPSRHGLMAFTHGAPGGHRGETARQWCPRRSPAGRRRRRGRRNSGASLTVETVLCAWVGQARSVLGGRTLAAPCAGSQGGVSLSANEAYLSPGGLACRSRMIHKALGIQAFEGRSVA